MSDETFEFLYPFVVVESAGGPFDDRSFAAGVQFGRVWKAFEDLDQEFETVVYRELVSQIDLAAMSAGWSMTHTEQGDWATAHFTPLPGGPTERNTDDEH